MVDPKTPMRREKLLKNSPENRRLHIVDSLHLTAFDRFPVEERFIDAFRRVWKKRKRSDKTELLEFWRQQDANMGIFPFPYIQLVANLLPGKADPTEERYAQCDEAGTILEFDATRIANMPDRLIETLISHELIHAARKAGNRATKDLDLEESFVRMANEKMGYDEHALTEWMQFNG